MYQFQCDVKRAAKMTRQRHVRAVQCRNINSRFYKQRGHLVCLMGRKLLHMFSSSCSRCRAVVSAAFLMLVASIPVFGASATPLRLHSPSLRLLLEPKSFVPEPLVYTQIHLAPSWPYYFRMFIQGGWSHPKWLHHFRFMKQMHSVLPTSLRYVRFDP